MRITKRLKYYALLLLPILAGCSSNAPERSLEEEEALQRLDETIKKAPRYRAEKLGEIDSLKRVLSKVSKDDYGALVRCNSVVAEAMNSYNGDSAMIYSRAALAAAEKLGNPDAILQTRIGLITSLSYAGYFLEGMTQYNALRDTPMSENAKLGYWAAGMRLYLGVSSFVPRGEFKQKYLNQAMEISDSLLNIIPHTNAEHRYLYGEQLYYNSQYGRSKDILSQVKDQLPAGGELEARVCYMLALDCKALRDTEGYVSYLARVAAINIKNVQYDGAALVSLADFLFEQGDVDKAYEYLNFAIKTASEGNGKMRSLALASSLPTIEEAYQTRLRHTQHGLIVFVVIVSVLFVVAIVLLWRYIKNNRQLREIGKQLEATTTMQETYIGNFITLCSRYSERLHKFANQVQRKIVSGQTEDLVKQIRQGKYADGQGEEYFCNVFDNAFLEIYPTFVDQLNNLLRPEEQIVRKDLKSLTPELRIYALIRMGIEDGGKISQVLGYSPNTVYAYRNKMRNKAIQRDTFDSDVKKISKAYVRSENKR